LSGIWNFLLDSENRTLLSWAGGGVVVVVGGLWAAFKWLHKKNRKPAAIPSVSATRGSLAVGRDIRDSTVTLSGEDER
jgi:hypothetical protein